jgi:hypothetical protein
MSRKSRGPPKLPVSQLAILGMLRFYMSNFTTNGWVEAMGQIYYYCFAKQDHVLRSRLPMSIQSMKRCGMQQHEHKAKSWISMKELSLKVDQCAKMLALKLLSP